MRKSRSGNKEAYKASRYIDLAGLLGRNIQKLEEEENMKHKKGKVNA